MCAIFGSTNLSTFEVLYEANKERGNFASSVVRLVDDDQWVLKKEGDIDFDKTKIASSRVKYYCWTCASTYISKENVGVDIRHIRSTLYPGWYFITEYLTNAVELEQWCSPMLNNPVDTAVIPGLLQHFLETCNSKKPKPVKYIKQALELLEGTFALSIIDCDTNEVYLARSGSILHYNTKGDYSTLPGKGYKEVPEGVILRLNTETNRFNKAGTFQVKSPFLFI